jgi:hypothetical protein
VWEPPRLSGKAQLLSLLVPVFDRGLKSLFLALELEDWDVLANRPFPLKVVLLRVIPWSCPDKVDSRRL